MTKVLYLAAVCQFWLPLMASAASVTTHACSTRAGICAVGISDLYIDGSTYNVSFVGDKSYDEVFFSSTPTFFGNSTAARDALAEVFQVLSATEIDGIVNNANYYDNLIIPFGVNGPIVNVVYGYVDHSYIPKIYVLGQSSSTLLAALNYNSTELPYDSLSYAVFEKTVPEPSTTALLAGALLALAIVRQSGLRNRSNVTPVLG